MEQLTGKCGLDLTPNERAISKLYTKLLSAHHFDLLAVNAITCMFCLESAFQALKVLRAAEYAPFVVFIAAPRPQDLPNNQYSVSDNTITTYRI